MKITTTGCNLGQSYYCPITQEICDPVNNCPLARFQARLDQENIPRETQTILIRIYTEIA